MREGMIECWLIGAPAWRTALRTVQLLFALWVLCLWRLPRSERNSSWEDQHLQIPKCWLLVPEKSSSWVAGLLRLFSSSIRPKSFRGRKQTANGKVETEELQSMFYCSNSCDSWWIHGDIIYHLSLCPSSIWIVVYLVEGSLLHGRLTISKHWCSWDGFTQMFAQLFPFGRWRWRRILNTLKTSTLMSLIALSRLD